MLFLPMMKSIIPQRLIMENSPRKSLKRLKSLKRQFISLIQEIKSNNISNNLHLLEERGLIDQSDGNEEEKYSSVIRQEK